VRSAGKGTVRGDEWRRAESRELGQSTGSRIKETAGGLMLFYDLTSFYLKSLFELGYLIVGLGYLVFN
jgi:hypothetical protein